MPEAFHLVTVVGARPQFVKVAAICRAIADHNARSPERPIAQKIVHTGQHYDENMSDVFFEEMHIPRPDYYLEVGSASHGAQTGRMLERAEDVLLREKPDRALIFGDTNSTLAGALAAVKLHIPIAHVEAGLRCYNHEMPEEVNRLVADHVSDLLFAPSEDAANNLRREGIAEERIFNLGDVMYDNALFYAARAEEKSTILKDLGLSPKGYILATVHRAESTDVPSRLAAIFEAFGAIAREIPLVLPLHPRTRLALERAGLLEKARRAVTIIEPTGYLDMVMLEKNAALVVSDSGGVPKEAFFHRVPSVILRRDAIWVELVEMGWAKIVPPETCEAILATIREGLSSGPGEDGMPYGDGRSAAKIVQEMLNKWLRRKV